MFKVKKIVCIALAAMITPIFSASAEECNDTVTVSMSEVKLLSQKTDVVITINAVISHTVDLIHATYDEGLLTNLEVTPISLSKGTNVFTVSADENDKIMLWNSISDMQPICDTITPKHQTINWTTAEATQYGLAIDANGGLGKISGIDWSDYNLGDLQLPDSINGVKLTSIKASTFSGCASLSSITIPEGVTSIGDNAFYYCYSLENIELPSTLVKLGSQTLAYCYNLQNINLPENVSEIGNNCFFSSLSGISVSVYNSNYAAVDGVLFDKNIKTLIYYPHNKTDISYTLPSTVNAVNSNAFYNNDNLKSIIIPGNTIKLNDYAFYKCDNLETITYEDSKSAWNTNVTAEKYWNVGMDIYVYCTDGAMLIKAPLNQSA